jgi:hypothetical protein
MKPSPVRINSKDPNAREVNPFRLGLERDVDPILAVSDGSQVSGSFRICLAAILQNDACLCFVRTAYISASNRWVVHWYALLLIDGLI